MSIDRTQLSSTCAVTGALGIGGKTIGAVHTFRHGTVEVVDIHCTDTVHYFVKTRHGQVEVGGTPEWGTGTLIGGR